MDKREEQNEQHSEEIEYNERKDQAENEQTNTIEITDLPDGNQLETEKTVAKESPVTSPHDKKETIYEADETMDEQTDIYYQDEAVVAIEEEKSESRIAETPQTKAGFWVRFWAYLIDVIIVFSLNGIVLAPLGFVRELPIFDWKIISVVGILSGIVYYLYFLLMTKFFQQTLGKMVMGIKVISATNDRLAWSDLLFREVIGRFIHNVFFILKLLYIVVAVTEDKRGVHDIIGNTRVIRAS